MKVEAIMTASPMTCRPADSLHDAAQRLWAEDCGSLPVVDGRNRLVGIITDRDIAMAGYLRNRRLAEIRVADSMSRQIAMCAPSDTVDLAMERMRTTRVRRLPICDDEGTLLGMLSIADVTQEALRSKERRLGEELLETIGQITAPRHAAAILTPEAKRSDAKPTTPQKPANKKSASKKVVAAASTAASGKKSANKKKAKTSARRSGKKKR